MDQATNRRYNPPHVVPLSSANINTSMNGSKATSVSVRILISVIIHKDLSVTRSHTNTFHLCKLFQQKIPLVHSPPVTQLVTEEPLLLNSSISVIGGKLDFHSIIIIGWL